VIIRRRLLSWHSPEMAEESYEDLSHYSRQEVRRLNQVPRNCVPAPAFQMTEKGVNGFVKKYYLGGSNKDCWNSHLQFRSVCLVRDNSRTCYLLWQCWGPVSTAASILLYDINSLFRWVTFICIFKRPSTVMYIATSRKMCFQSINEKCSNYAASRSTSNLSVGNIARADPSGSAV
jgi:hypothetical protein